MTAIVCPVRKGGRTDTLRYMLRTLTNLDGFDGEVWIVGHKPPWLAGVHFIPGNRSRIKAHNVYSNIRAACNHPDVPDHFILTNDDVFILRPGYVPAMEHKGLLLDHYESIPAAERHTWHPASLLSTLTYLQQQGIQQPLSYEGHKPLPVNKQGMARALNDAVRHEAAHTAQARTIYGNTCHLPATHGPDRKVKDQSRMPHDWPIISTNQTSWNSHIGKHIRATFTQPSPYEADRQTGRQVPPHAHAYPTSHHMPCLGKAAPQHVDTEASMRNSDRNGNH